MTALLSIIAVITLSVGSGAAWASQCPSLIGKARAELEQYKKKPGLAAIKDARIAALGKTGEANSASPGPFSRTPPPVSEDEMCYRRTRASSV